jgi:hypothetical protein
LDLDARGHGSNPGMITTFHRFGELSQNVINTLSNKMPLMWIDEKK